MNTPNVMNYWAELTKDFSEITKKNIEMVTKFSKTSGERGDEIIAKNMDIYFNYLNTNIGYLNTIWTNNHNAGKEFRETFRGQLDEAYSKFMDIYRQTSQNMTQGK